MAVKFFNSLCTIHARKLNELICLSKKALRKLLLLADIHTRFNKSVSTDYTIMEIFKLLNKGVYCKVPRFPENLKQTLFVIIDQSDEEQHKILLTDLTELWDGSDPDIFINEVVENLSFRYLHQNESDFSLKDVQSTVSSFFLIPDETRTELITRNLIDQKGLAYD